MKLDDVKNTEMGKAKKSNFLAACLSGKNEEDSQCPACKKNLKQILVPHLICKLRCNCSKYNVTHVVKNFLAVHTIITRQNTYKNYSFDISPPSSLLVTTIFSRSNNIPRSVEDATLLVLKKENEIKSLKIFD